LNIGLNGLNNAIFVCGQVDGGNNKISDGVSAKINVIFGFICSLYFKLCFLTQIITC